MGAFGTQIAVAYMMVKADLSEFEKGLSGVSGKLSSAFSHASGAIASLGLGQLAKDAVNFGAEYRIQLDQASAAVTGLLKPEEDAGKLLRDMTEFAINTPFSLPGVQTTISQLLAVGRGFGVTGDNVLDFAETIGNVTAITGGTDDTMMRITRTLGQMSSTGKVLGQDMNQLAQNIPGFDVWDALATGTGKSKEELRKLQDEGKLDELLTGNEAVEMLIAGMQKMNTQFETNSGGISAMDAKMNTLGGSIEIFKDTMGVALAEGLKPFFDTFQTLLKNPAIQKGLTRLAEAFGKLAGKLIEELAPVLPDLVDSFILIVEALAPATPAIADMAKAISLALVAMAPLIEMLASFIAWLTKLFMKLDPAIIATITAALITLWLVGFGPVGYIAAAIVALGIIIYKNWDTIVAATQAAVDAMVAAWNWLFDNVIDPVINFVETIIRFFQNLYDTLVGNSIIPDLIDAIIGFFTTLWDTVVEIVTTIVDTIVAIWDTVWGLIEPIFNIIKAGVELYFNIYKTIITTAIDLAISLVTTAFNGLKSTLEGIWSGIQTAVETAWNLIHDYIVDPIDTAVTWVTDRIDDIVDYATELPGRMVGLFDGMWDGIKDAFRTAINFVINGLNSIKLPGITIGGWDPPGPGSIPSWTSPEIDPFPYIRPLAAGGLLSSPTLGWLAENGRAEAVIPLTNPARAMELMQQSGLDLLAAQMSGGGRFGGPLVTMPGAIIQDATDADLVAQRTLVAMQAAMIAA